MSLMMNVLPDLVRLHAMPCRYRTTAEEDDATIASSSAGPRQKVAARLLRIEKEILNGMGPIPPVSSLSYSRK